MAKNLKLDEIDIKILTLLSNNGRIHYKDIAKIVRLKPPSVIDRIKKLESEKIIKGYTVLVDEKKLGIDITGFIGVNIDHPKNIDNFESITNELKEEILECHHVTGDFTLLLKVKARNTAELEKLIGKIRSTKGVIKTHTMIVFSTITERPYMLTSGASK
jgi:Lrp/AsnC family leucine-responsive transcriptional regulator